MPTQPKRILVIEDNHTERQKLQTLLRDLVQHPLELEFVASVADAKKLFQRGLEYTFNLIFVDAVLSDGVARDAWRYLKDFVSSDTRVALLTVMVDNADSPIVEGISFDWVIEKPLEPAFLADTIIPTI